MKNNIKAMLCPLLAGFALNAEAATISVAPTNYGTIWSYMVEATNDPHNQPYAGTISLNDYGYSQAVVELDVLMLPSTPYYYLALNPWSVWSGLDPTNQVGIFSYAGDGRVTRSDYSVGSLAGIVDLHWDDQKGYPGIVKFDLTALVSDARANNLRYLGLNIRDFTPTMSGVLFSSPSILGSDEPLEPPVSKIPEPSSLWLVAGAVFAYISSSLLFRKGVTRSVSADLGRRD